jgi:thioredoxin 1
MNKTLLAVVGVLIIVGVGFAAYNSNSAQKQTEMEKKAMMEKEAMMMAEKEAMMAASGTDSMMKKDDAMMMAKGEGDTMMKKDEAMMAKAPGMYTTYDASKLSLAKDNKVVIFFHAGWCPTCRALDSEISSKGVKEGYVILKADYDTQKALKAKYGVTSQHTLVQVDANGNQLMKWSGGDLGMIYSKAK